MKYAVTLQQKSVKYFIRWIIAVLGPKQLLWSGKLVTREAVISKEMNSFIKRHKCAYACSVAGERKYASCTQLCTQIFAKPFIGHLYFPMNLSFKLYKDLRFHCGDICKTIETFVKSSIFYLFSIFSKIEHQSSPEIWKIHEGPWNLGDILSQ